MDWQAALRARLTGASAVTDLVGTRIYWVERPQSSALPAITLQTVDDRMPQHMKGFDGLDVARVQVDVWGRTYAEVRPIVRAAIDALAPANTSNGVRFERAFVDGVRDLGEQTETVFVHRTAVDLIVHHAAA